jgi:hypothetical protein
MGFESAGDAADESCKLAPSANLENATLADASDPVAIRRRREMSELSMVNPVGVEWLQPSPVRRFVLAVLSQHLTFGVYSIARGDS